MNSTLQKTVAVLLLSGALLLSAASCSKKDVSAHVAPSYDSLSVEEYVRLERYTELSVPLASEDASKSDAVWAYLLSLAEILSYPQDAVDYYVVQGQEVYRHYAEEHEITYEEALSRHGVSEESIRNEALSLVKSDLLYRYIVTDAQISLSDAEKETHYDRYADRIATQYGYRRDYVDEELRDLVYDAMLYDKTMGYLILNNQFTVSQ